MKLNRKILINIYIFLFSLYIFTNLILGIQIPMIIAISFFLIIIQLISKKSVKMTFFDLLLVMFEFIMAISILYSTNKESAIKYVVVFGLLVLNFIYFSKEKELNYNYILKLLLFFSGIHVFATLFYQLFPGIMQQILPMILKGSDLSYNLMAFNIQHINCGISPIQNANAMYIAVFIGCVFSKLICGENKIRNSLFLVAGLIALLLASKRGVLLGVVIALVFEYMILFKKISKNMIKQIFKFLLLVVLFIIIGKNVIYNYFPDATRIIERFFNQEDITTGRGHMYEILFNNYISNNIFLGNGLFSSRTVLYNTLGSSNDAHNIYLQILVELGLPGIFCFAAILVLLYRKICKVEINAKNKVICGYSIFYIILFLVYGISGNDLFDLSVLPMFLFVIEIIVQNKKGKVELNEGRNFNIS